MRTTRTRFLFCSDFFFFFEKRYNIAQLAYQTNITCEAKGVLGKEHSVTLSPSKVGERKAARLAKEAELIKVRARNLEELQERERKIQQQLDERRVKLSKRHVAQEDHLSSVERRLDAMRKRREEEEVEREALKKKEKAVEKKIAETEKEIEADEEEVEASERKMSSKKSTNWKVLLGGSLLIIGALALILMLVQRMRKANRKYQ